jgi:hypothetical protein
MKTSEGMDRFTQKRAFEKLMRPLLNIKQALIGWRAPRAVRFPDGGMLTAQAPSGWDPMTLLQWIGSDVLNQINCDFVVRSRVLIGSGTELDLCVKGAASLRGEVRQARVV